MHGLGNRSPVRCRPRRPRKGNISVSPRGGADQLSSPNGHRNRAAQPDPATQEAVVPQQHKASSPASTNPTPSTLIRTLIVDDQAVARIALRSLHHFDVNIEIVGEAATAAEALTAFEQLQPDVVILDVGLPDQSGIEVCRQIKARNPRTRVLMLSVNGDYGAVLSAIHAGTDGYLLKREGVFHVVEGIHDVMRGGACLDSSLARLVLEYLRREAVLEN